MHPLLACVDNCTLSCPNVSIRQFGLEKLHAWLEPILIKAVTTMSGAYCSELTRKTTEATEELKHPVQVLTLRNDELEQYTRRDNVKIHGLPKSDNEDTIEQVVQLAKKAGVVIDANDISIAHRLPGNRHANKPRTIIAKFVRRVKRTDLMRKKLGRAERLHHGRPHQDAR